MRIFLLAFSLLFFANAASAAPAAPAAAPVAAQSGETLLLKLKSGDVVIKLRPDLAPNHVARIKTLAAQGFYNGIVFHRVIAGFMAQTGDPTGTGMGGSKLPDLKAEFSKAKFERGTVGMARSANPDSANSQWFINLAPTPGLDGQYTIWGEVVSGMEHVDAIKKGSGDMGLVAKPQDQIVSLKVVSPAAAKPKK